MTERTSGKAKVTKVSDTELAIEREFDAPRERVYEAYTDRELLEQWWGPRNTTMIVDKLDVKPGGAWRFVHKMEDGSEHGFRGEFRELEPPERLVWTFEWEGMPGEISVETVEFEDLGGRTRVKTISTFDSPEGLEGMLSSGMEDGMNESYERLDELLAKD